jgi:hypothetical protein
MAKPTTTTTKTAPATTTAAPAAPEAKETTKDGKPDRRARLPRQKAGKKTPLDHLAKAIGVASQITRRALASYTAWGKQAQASETIRTFLAQAADSAGSASDAYRSLEQATAGLVTAGFAPPKAPTASKWNPGDLCRIKAKFVPAYTRHGLYTKEELQHLTLTAVAGAEARARPRGAQHEIHVRWTAHLERLSGEAVS